ncbi:hypothetical protein [Pedobacter insulae]|uniref:Uncharacterized protein n=1 Tax=Pedobacter insulae TaxID=414048 RepID=A0A1I2ZGY3_9SPHI|nr:hypothetical protein [Pedobacter insulae]SFH37078.1 hypothetical protein SAMN04489864_11022 [Pedobacter insulae]
MANLKNIINKNQPNFEIWEQQLNDHLLAQFNPDAIQDKFEHERIFFQTNGLLSEIAENFFSFGQFKDEWDTSKCSIFPFGQYLLLRSRKMDIVFDWGMDMKSFYLETNLKHSDNMRFMTDDFWAALLELKTLGKFELSGGGGLNSEQRSYFENKTSAVFQLIRTFMLNQTERMNDGNCQWEYPSLTLKWEMDNNWVSLLEDSCKAFRLMYQLSYQLWKVDDQMRKKQ